MFGFGKSGDMESLVKKKSWDKIRKKYLDGTQEEQVALAKACKTSKCDDSVNILISLLDYAKDDEVKIEILRSLSEVGTNHAVSLVQVMLTETGGTDSPLRTAILDTLRVLRAKA